MINYSNWVTGVIMDFGGLFHTQEEAGGSRKSLKIVFALRHIVDLHDYARGSFSLTMVFSYRLIF